MDTQEPLVKELVPVRSLFDEWQQKLQARRLSAEGDAELELSAEEAREIELPPLVPALLENNLSRKGIWTTDPNRHRLEWQYHTEDIVGSLTVEYSLGQLSTFEMELVAWILGRWNTDLAGITFSLRECAKEFGTKWGGSRSEFLKDALRRIDRTRFTGRIWEASTRKRVTRHFGIFDGVKIVDQADSLDGPTFEPGTVSVTLSSFLLEQLRARQFVRLDWGVLRRGITSPLGKRLYVFLEGQKGFPAQDGFSMRSPSITSSWRAWTAMTARSDAFGPNLCALATRSSLPAPATGRSLFDLARIAAPTSCGSAARRPEPLSPASLPLRGRKPGQRHDAIALFERSRMVP